MTTGTSTPQDAALIAAWQQLVSGTDWQTANPAATFGKGSVRSLAAPPEAAAPSSRGSAATIIAKASSEMDSTVLVREPSSETLATRRAGSDPKRAMASPPESVRHSIDGSSPSQESPRHPGYELGAEIGRGGMGRVFRARQRALGRDVALKSLLPGADQVDAEDFVTEAQITAQLEHPNIVPVYDLNQGGAPELVMKLVGGQSWEDLLEKDRPWERDDAASFDSHLRVLEQLSFALSFAHDKGVLHLDIKPSNVMLGDHNEVLLMDWGVAVTVEGSAVSGTSAKSLTSPRGTPLYMAPEMALGLGRELSPRTDVYLLGACLFEIMTGSAPHVADSLLGILTHAIHSPEVRFNHRVPEELAQICRRALSREASNRFESAAAFRAAIAEYQRHRQSSMIADQAFDLLERGSFADKGAAAESEGSTAPTVNRYGDFAAAISSFRQALSLWPENSTASRGLVEAHQTFAKFALRNDQLQLADAQILRLREVLGRAAESSPELRVIEAGYREARRRQGARAQAQRWTRLALLALSVLTILGTVLYLRSLDSLNKELRQAKAETEDSLRRSQHARQVSLGLLRNFVNEAQVGLDGVVGRQARDARQRLLVSALQALEDDGPVLLDEEMAAEERLRALAEKSRLLAQNQRDLQGRASVARSLRLAEEQFSRSPDAAPLYWLGALRVQAALCSGPRFSSQLVLELERGLSEMRRSGNSGVSALDELRFYWEPRRILATELIRMGRVDEAREVLAQCSARVDPKKLEGEADPRAALAMRAERLRIALKLAELDQVVGDSEQASKNSELAVEEARALFAEHHGILSHSELLCSALSLAAVARAEQGRAAESLELRKEAWEVGLNLRRMDQRSRSCQIIAARVTVEYGHRLLLSAELQRAREVLESVSWEALEIEKDYASANAWLSLGRCRDIDRRPLDAIECYNKAIARISALSEPLDVAETLVLVAALEGKGDAESTLKKFSEAGSSYREAQDRAQKVLQRSPQLSAFRLLLADLAMRRSNMLLSMRNVELDKEAEALLGEARAQVAQVLSLKPSSSVARQSSLIDRLSSVAALRLGKAREALEFAEQAVRRNEALPLETPRRAEELSRLYEAASKAASKASEHQLAMKRGAQALRSCFEFAVTGQETGGGSDRLAGIAAALWQQAEGLCRSAAEADLPRSDVLGVRIENTLLLARIMDYIESLDGLRQSLAVAQKLLALLSGADESRPWWRGELRYLTARLQWKVDRANPAVIKTCEAAIRELGEPGDSEQDRHWRVCLLEARAFAAFCSLSEMNESELLENENERVKSVEKSLADIGASLDQGEKDWEFPVLRARLRINVHLTIANIALTQLRFVEARKRIAEAEVMRRGLTDDESVRRSFEMIEKRLLELEQEDRRRP